MKQRQRYDQWWLTVTSRCRETSHQRGSETLASHNYNSANEGGQSDKPNRLLLLHVLMNIYLSTLRADDRSGRKSVKWEQVTLDLSSPVVHTSTGSRCSTACYYIVKCFGFLFVRLDNSLCFLPVRMDGSAPCIAWAAPVGWVFFWTASRVVPRKE